MGNTCVGPSITKTGFFQSVSATLWRARSPGDVLPRTNGEEASTAPARTATEPPNLIKIHEEEEEEEGEETKPAKPPPPPQVEARPPNEPSPPKSKKKPHHVKRASSAGLLTDSVLRRKTGNLKDVYSIGRKLGQGQFGTTYLCVEKANGKEYACKSILKRKLTTDDDVEDVRREIQIMHHLSGHPNVILIEGAYEDAVAVHVIMELCGGGELFDRIIQKGHYTERKAAELARVIVGVVEVCHSLGVMHRDLKPENFLFVNQTEEAPLKTIDFGLSIFFQQVNFLSFKEHFFFRLKAFLPLFK